VQATVFEVSRTNTPTWAESLRISPNPTTGVLNIVLEQFEGGKMNFSLKNSQGALLQNTQRTLPSGHAAFQADLSQLPAGIYWLELATERGTVQRKVAVSR
jgi:hypothetical protein